MHENSETAEYHMQTAVIITALPRHCASQFIKHFLIFDLICFLKFIFMYLKERKRGREVPSNIQSSQDWARLKQGT